MIGSLPVVTHVYMHASDPSVMHMEMSVTGAENVTLALLQLMGWSWAHGKHAS